MIRTNNLVDFFAWAGVIILLIGMVAVGSYYMISQLSEDRRLELDRFKVSCMHPAVKLSERCKVVLTTEEQELHKFRHDDYVNSELRLQEAKRLRDQIVLERLRRDLADLTRPVVGICK